MQEQQSITELTELLKMTVESVKRLEDKLDVRVHGISTEREFYTVREVADIVGLQEFTVREHCKNGAIDAEKSSSGRWRITRDAIAKFMDSR